MQETDSSDRLRYLPAIFILAGISVIILAVLLVSSRTPGLSINEIMFENDSFYPGREGSFPDWIELYNPTNKPIDLTGMYLSDDQRNLKKWQIAEEIIEPWDYLVLESGNDSGRSFPFGISTNDRNIILTGKDGRIIQSVSLRKTGKNHSMAWDGIHWTESSDPSPGYANTAEGHAMYFSSISTNEYALRINEYCPSNQSGVTDGTGEHPDWIELLNYGDSDINLSGFGLSDSSDDLFRWQFPSTMLPSGGYILVFASGKDIKKNSKWFHTGFSLNGQHDSIILSSPQGKIIDRIDIDNFPVEAESAGIVDGNMLYFTSHSAGTANGAGLKTCPWSVSLSHVPGFYNGSITLALSGNGGTIRYTTDGSGPDGHSPVYRKALTIEKNTVIRARIFADGCIPGKITSATYFIHEKSTLPVFSIALDPALLYSDEKGLLVPGKNHAEEFPYVGANFWQEWEYPASVEMFGPDSKELFSATAGLKIFGAYSRALPQKSFVLKFRNIYGMPRLAMRLFPEKEIYSYESFVLRSGGQDSQRTKLRDLVAGKLAGLLGLEYQAGYPVLLFLNGEYYGLCNLREKIEDSFLAANTGRPDKKGFDLIQGNTQVLAGSYDHYRQVIRFAARNNLALEENYEKICQWVDIEDYIDYHLLQVYIGNLDGGNIRFWRGTAPGDKWRWIVFDTDYSFYEPQRNVLESWLDPEGRGHAKLFSTLLITRLLQNEDFRDLFIRRFIYHLKYTLDPEIVTEIMRRQAALIAPEMPRQVEKWGLKTDESWEQMVDDMLSFAQQRNVIVLRNLKKHFRLSDTEFRKYLEQ
ncbi:MAG: CotH kinase family protein [Spirochaetales bacterium]|nr:CotH kinase family protein [Spirochaetales bacterium]